MRRSIWALILVIPLVAVLASGFSRDPSVIASPLLNKPAPAFTLRTLDRKPISLAALRNKVVVVNFWATWCLSCRAEHEALLAAWRAYHRRGTEFVGVLYQDSLSAAGSFFQQYGGNWPVVDDPGATTAVNYGVVAVPETYFIDRRGIVRYKAAGPLTSTILHRQIDRLLKEGG